MEKLVCWKLMGLRRNGAFDVWYQLDSYPTAEEAKLAAADPKVAELGYLQTQVMPYYRMEMGSASTSASPPVQIQSAAKVGTGQAAKSPATAV